MKAKILSLLVVFLFSFSSANILLERSCSYEKVCEISKQTNNQIYNQIYDQNFTHTVLAELGALSWCPHCPGASEALHEVFSSGEYNFYYVTLVYDKNVLAQKRGAWLRDAYAPVLYIDGGYDVVDYDSRNAYSDYSEAIASAGERNVHDLDLTVTATWMGNAKIDVAVSIKNNEKKPYFGHLRVYVTEMVSRWVDHDNLPFNYAFLDYAFNTYVLIGSGKTFETNKVWDGASKHGNLTFEDIEPSNIMIIATISHWLPHIEKNPWENPSPYFLAQYVDEVSVAIPS